MPNAQFRDVEFLFHRLLEAQGKGHARGCNQVAGSKSALASSRRCYHRQDAMVLERLLAA